MQQNYFTADIQTFEVRTSQTGNAAQFSLGTSKDSLISFEL